MERGPKAKVQEEGCGGWLALVRGEREALEQRSKALLADSPPPPPDKGGEGRRGGC